jgi:hypothetical protein
MAKIQFADDNVGSSNNYELTYNPVEIDAPTARAGEIANSVETVDGESITFTPYHDSRRGYMRWRGYRSDTSATGVAFEDMIEELEGYVGGYKYMYFGDLTTAFGVYPDVPDGWQKIKVIAVNKSVRSGGSIIYDPVELVWEDVEE